ncbi:MAG: methyltransferase domain-containing protein [Ktedonobacterales bacterium]
MRDAAHTLDVLNGPMTQTRWIRYLDTVTQLDFMQAVKLTITARLDVHAGDSVLDAGCGTGDDVRAMAPWVEPTGRIVGLDIHEETLAEARRRAEEAEIPVEFVQGDVQRLLFADDTFTACRAERMFQHLEDPRQALHELVRVTRSGGRIVIFDTDWETLTVDADDTTATRAILRTKCNLLRHGWIGRQLAGLMHQAGLRNIMVEPASLILTDGPLAIALHGLRRAAEVAQQRDQLTREQCDAWFDDVLRRHAERRFFSSVTAFIVCGSKP